MSISKQEIKHVADLARLGLSPAELDRYGEQLSAILDYIDQLQAVDTKRIEVTAQVSGLENIWRPDEVLGWPQDELDLAFSQGDIVEGKLKVKKVL